MRTSLVTMLSIAFILLFLITGVALSQTWTAGTSTLYADPTTTNVGIGTSDLDGSPAIGKLTIKGTTNDGTTNIIVGRDSDESNVFSVNSDGKITGSALSTVEYITNDTNEVQISSSMFPITSSSNTSYHAGGYHVIRPVINTGATQAGHEMGIYTEVLRNNYNSSADENGTLVSLYGQQLIYGHNNTNTSAIPITTNIYGMRLYPYYKAGTIANCYDLFIASGATGGTITNRYAIYQQSSAANNYFAGNVGIGTTSPRTKLDVIDSYGIYNRSSSGGGIFFDDTDVTDSDIPISYIKGDNGTLRFFRANRNASTGLTTGSIESLCIDSSGNVGIGTTTPDYKVDVLGTIRAQEVKVASGWSDFVFDDNYNLPSLTQVESYIEENKHLPDIPSAKEIQEGGLSMAEMMAKQMQKIEELTLYVIEQNKKIEKLENKLAQLGMQE